MNKERLNLMKKDALLVNASRGPVVDEVALVNHLKANPDFRQALPSATYCSAQVGNASLRTAGSNALGADRHLLQACFDGLNVLQVRLGCVRGRARDKARLG